MLKTDWLAFLILAAYVLLQQGGVVPQQERLIDVEGVAALVAHQDGDRHKYTQVQRDIIGGAGWTSACDSYRILDNEAEFTAPSPYQPVFDRRPKALPWCVISGPGKQYEGPLPESVEAMVKLVEAAHG